MLLKDKVAVITGGGSGIGRETAILFAEQGARVVIGDIQDDWAAATVRMAKDVGGDVHYVHADVTRDADVERLVKTAAESFGRLDVMFNHAGVATPRPYRPLWEYTEADWDRLMHTNLRSVFYGCRHAVPLLQTSGGGVIINMGSAAGLVSWGGVPYGASKAGVINLSRGLAVELAAHGIRVNCICPGAVDTNFGRENVAPAPEEFIRAREALRRVIPLGRVADPGEVAHTALFLASDLSSYVTGSTLVVDGGYTVKQG